MASLPQIETHSDPDHLADDLGFAWITEDFRNGLGGYVRHGDQHTIAFGAPTAAVAVPVFDKVNWALVLVRPAIFGHLPLGFINLNERAGGDQGIHEPVLGADEGIAMASQIEGFEQQSRNRPPGLDMAGQVGGVAEVDRAIQMDGKLNAG